MDGVERVVPGVILLTLLLRITLAFIVLSIAKERQELEQRVDALTDALTGLPNRRALFEAADALGQDGTRGRRNFGAHLRSRPFQGDQRPLRSCLGDRVLKLFAHTA